MRLSPLLVSFALIASASAQTTGKSPAVVLQAPPSQGCPVSFEARRANSGALINVSPSEKHRGQGYLLSFLPQGGQGIAQARITLHGLSGAGVIPAGEKAGADATKSFNVSPSAGANRYFHSMVYTGRLTGVQWVELNEITYADGTEWQESADATCRVAPNGFMLVASCK